MRHPSPLQDRGLVLRPWRTDDAPALAAAANHVGIGRYLSSRFPYPYSLADAEHFLAGGVIDLADPVLAIELDGEVAGGIGARPEQPGRAEFAHSALLGYWLSPSHWGRGVMRRAVALFAPWVMDEMRLYRLAAHVVVGNEASARVLLGSGFQEEGTMRRAAVKAGQPLDLRLFARVRDRVPPTQGR